MRKAIIIFGAILLIILVSKCYYDSEEYLFPNINNNCDTTSVTFSLSVKPILQNNCYGCHSNSNYVLGGNVKLENYSDVVTVASNGKLIGTITHANGFVPMPDGAPMLDDCKIATLRKWIDEGMLNN